ncbi:MAG: hypothetical protein ABJA81_12625 [Nocardioidaceae bacterium]
MPMWRCPYRLRTARAATGEPDEGRRGQLSICAELCMLDRMRVFLIRPAVAVVALAMVLAACTHDDHKSAPPSPSDSSSPSTAASTKLTKPNAPLKVTIGAMKGGVDKKRRDGLRRAAAKPIASWMQAAFLAGKYPHSSFPHAFASWTGQAAKLALHDSGVTTNAPLGKDLVGLVADQRSATLYIFATRGVTGGATAKVRMMLTGEKSNGTLTKFMISGNIYLTRKLHAWRIFGYDLDRTVVR